MSDRGARKGVLGAPFYAPPRRKTSAEIISEARAAVYGDEGGASSGVGGGGGGLRPLRTRRPFTPQESQRTLFADRTRRKEPRPPSSFNLKNLSVSESGDKLTRPVDPGNQAPVTHTDTTNGIGTVGTPTNVKKKTRTTPHGGQHNSGDGWSGYTKLPHLSGRTKPLHRRNTAPQDEDLDSDLSELTSAIFITQPIPAAEFESIKSTTTESFSKKSTSTSKRGQYSIKKSWSCEATVKNTPINEDISVKHIKSAGKKPSEAMQSLEYMTVLELSECLLERNRDPERTKLLLSALVRTIEQDPCSGSVREMALRSLYSHVDTEDEENQVDIARALFMLRVTGPHLATACKLVFKVAKHDRNDHFFKNTNLLELVIEGMGMSSPVAEAEVSVYGAGAVRVVTADPLLRDRAVRAGAVHLLGLHLKIINDVKSQQPSSANEQWSHALYQITGALRNLAGGDTRAFLHAGVLNDILVALHVHRTDRDVLVNLVRCLSVVSCCESCLRWLCGRSSAARETVRAAAECGARGALLVRLLYVLGNMAAHHHSARTNIYDEEGSVDILLTIIESYAERSERMDARDIELDYEPIDNDMGTSRGTNEDVLIKAIRVFANLCLSEREGRGLAKNHFTRIGNALLRCLYIARKKQISELDVDAESDNERREELATAALATLNNVTFYRDSEADDALEDNLIDLLCQETCRWVVSCDSPASCEAVRALGNLTRSTQAALFFLNTGAINHVEPFLCHEESSVRCGAAGVLVNICGCGGGGVEGGEVTAGGLIRAARVGDAPLAALLLRALWNAHAHTPLDAKLAAAVVDAIHVFIDDESVFAPCEAQRSTPSDRRASDPDLSKHHVKFQENNNDEYEADVAPSGGKLYKTLSVGQELNADRCWDDEGCSGEDLGFEEGELVGDDGCDCGPCSRLAEWDELVAVAIPLLEKLKRADASVGTET